MSLKQIAALLKGTCTAFGKDKVLRLSAALAYYSMFSIGPILLIAVGVAGLVFGPDAVRNQIEQQLQSLVGEGSAKMVGSMMGAQKHGASVISTILGLVALLFGAAGVFGQLQDALNTIWEVKSKPGAGLWGFIRSRFLSLSMVLGVGFLLLVSMVLSTFLSATTGALGNTLPIPETLAHVLNFTLSFAVISVLFAMIFKYLPDVKIPFNKVWIGAIGTALLFTLGKYLLGLYLARESTSSPYGAAGSVIVILMWIYYASIILLFGAEFTQVYARQTGAVIVPTKYAVPVALEQRAQEGIPVQAGSGQPASKTEPPAGPEGRLPWQPQAHAVSAGAVATQKPWQLLLVMFAAGFAGGLLLKGKSSFKALRDHDSVIDLRPSASGDLSPSTR